MSNVILSKLCKLTPATKHEWLSMINGHEYGPDQEGYILTCASGCNFTGKPQDLIFNAEWVSGVEVADHAEFVKDCDLATGILALSKGLVIRFKLDTNVLEDYQYYKGTPESFILRFGPCVETINSIEIITES